MNIMKGALIVMTAILAQLLSACAHQKPVEVFRTDGEVRRADSGWTYQASPGTEIVYIPFEGYYPDKGGRMQSLVFPLPDSGGLGAYYRLTFNAKTAEHCYWWLDYFDPNDEVVHDCNSKVYPGNNFRDYDEVVYVPARVRHVRIAFVSKGKVEARDIRFTTATAAEAAKWCDDLYKTMPPLKFTAPPDSMALLPKTVAAMKNGTPWRVVMLGNSLMDDSVNSLFMALVQRDFPASRFNVVGSVRGQTGCGFYRIPEQFQKYVVAHKPELLMILDSTGGEDLEAVVKMTREQVGCEILVINTPLGGDWRKKAETLDWRSFTNRSGGPAFNIIPVRNCTQKLNVAFWDMTSPCNDYLAAAGDIDFTRDYVHNNDVGKQIIGRVLHQYFLTAK